MLMVCMVLVSGVAGGCGTAANFYDNGPWLGANPPMRRIYGGVRTDLECAGKILTLPERTLESDGGVAAAGTLVVAPVGLALTAIDLPLSFVADSLTLPFVLAYPDESQHGLPPPHSLDNVQPDGKVSPPAQANGNAAQVRPVTGMGFEKREGVLPR